MLPEVIDKHKKITGYNLFTIYKNSPFVVKNETNVIYNSTKK